MRPEIGFQSAESRPTADDRSKLESIALAGVSKRFSPEFVNRIDAVITYHPLDADVALDRFSITTSPSCSGTCTRGSANVRSTIDVSQPARRLLLEKGSSRNTAPAS